MSNADIAQIVSVLQDSFRILIENDDVEVATSEGEVELIADDWTLSFWAPSGELTAFLAIDDEPEDVGRMSAALDAALRESDMTVLRDANAQVDGGIAAALRRSRDRLSEALAGVIESMG